MRFIALQQLHSQIAILPITVPAWGEENLYKNKHQGNRYENMSNKEESHQTYIYSGMRKFGNPL